MNAMTQSWTIRKSLCAGLATAALLAGLAAPTPAPAAPPSVESQRRVDAAAKHMEKGDVPAAVIELKNAILADGGNSAARYELALLYLRLGDAAAAERELETARSRGFDEVKIMLPLARTYYVQRRFRDVTTRFDAAKLAGEARGDMLALQARAHIALQEHDKARVAIDAALAENLDRPNVLAADTTLLRLKGDFAGAERQLDKAIAKEPDQPEFLVMKAELRQQQQDYAGAEALLSDVVRKYPNFLRAYTSRAIVYIVRDNPAGAASDIEYVLARDANNGIAQYLSAVMLARQQKYREAAQALINQPQLTENFPPAAYLLAASSFYDNRIEIARAWAQRYVARVPDDVSGAKLLAAIHLRQKSPAQAVDILERVVARHPDDADLKVRLANAYLDAGRSETALQMLEQGAARDPGNSSTQLALAVGQLRTGDVDDGTAQLQKVLEMNPGSVQANIMMVLTHLRGRTPEKALETTADMIKANPDDPNAYNLEGTVRLATNNHDGARKAFRTALEKDPGFTAAALNLARVEERSGNAAEARKWYEQALRMTPTSTTAFEGLAALALRGGDYDGAIKQYETAIARDPAAPTPRLRMIELLLQRPDNARALNAARDFVAAAPDNISALEALGRAQVASGDFVNGIGSYRRLANDAASNPEAHRRLGLVYVAAAAKEKQNATAYLGEARAAFDRAIAAAPDHEAALSDRLKLEYDTKGAEAAVALGRDFVTQRPKSAVRLAVLGDAQSAARKPADAAATYQKAWDMLQDGAILRRLYAAMAQTGRGAEGLGLLKSWASKNPTDYDTRLMLASHYINARQYDSALQETEDMNKTMPGNPLVLNNLAWLYGEKNDPKAIAVAEEAYALAPRSSDVADTLGWLHVQKGDAAKGAEILGKAHALAPERADIAYRYAVALDKRGDKPGARAALQKALAGKTPFNERPQAEALLKQLGS